MLPHGAGVPVMLRHARRLVGLLGSWGEGGQLGHGSGEDSTVPRRVDVKAAPGGIWREGSSVCPDQQVPGDERAVVRVVNDGLEAALSRSGCITAADLEACCVPSVPCDRCILLGSSERCLQPDRELPELERRTRGRTVLMAACGGLHSAAVTDEGLLFTWGHGGYGQLGHGGRENKLVPWHVPLSSFGGVRVRMAAAGRAHTAVVTEAGIVFTWGSGFGGQLGHGDVEDRTVPTAIPRESFRGSGATLIACGRDYTAAVVHDGALFAWGNNPEGVLGLGYGDCDRHVPALVVDRKGLGGSNCVLVACGVAHSAAVSEDGSLYTWGLGEHGRLGHGDTARRLRPSLVPPSAFAHAPVTMVDLGGKHSVAVTEAGALYTWGYGEYGRLGHRDTASRLVPTLVAWHSLGCERVAMAACGASHTAVVTESGRLYTWGDAESAQLGHADREHKLEPVELGAATLNNQPVGRFRRLPTEHSLSFAMVSHSRLGAQSAFGGMLAEHVRAIVELTYTWPKEPTASSEGVVRLLGGGLLC